MHFDLFSATSSMIDIGEALIRRKVGTNDVNRVMDVIHAYMVKRDNLIHTTIPVTVTISDIPQPKEMILVQLTYGLVQVHFLINGDIHLVVK